MMQNKTLCDFDRLYANLRVCVLMRMLLMKAAKRDAVPDAVVQEILPQPCLGPAAHHEAWGWMTDETLVVHVALGTN